MKTTIKALEILEVFLNGADPLSLAELAGITKLNASTAHRIVKVLVKNDYLDQISKRGKYCIGPKLLEWGRGDFPTPLGYDIREVAYPYLKALNKAINEGIDLAILSNNEAAIIEYFGTDHRLQFAIQIGDREPLHCTSIGKVLLAGMEEEELEDYLREKGLPRHTEYTITDSDRLKEELLIIKRDGIAINKEELELGMVGIAAPIKNAGEKVIAAICVVGPNTRFNDQMIEDLKPLVSNSAIQISNSIAFRKRLRF